MSYLDVVLLAEARRTGRGVRSAHFRHRRIQRRPMVIVPWQLGAEPFTAAAVAWGFAKSRRSLVVSCEPRDRELSFRALTEMARAFNSWFEGDRDEAPQIVVANRGALSCLGRLARRVAFLPTDGPRPADPELVKFGKHLRFLSDGSRHPGQSLVLVLTELLASHWVTELSELEAQNLPAMAAAIAPPKGLTGHGAAFALEGSAIGPIPSAEDDRQAGRLIEAFNERRTVGEDRSTDEGLIAPLRREFERHYGAMVDRSWGLLFDLLAQERAFPEAPSAGRRFDEDVAALERHIEWVTIKEGRLRTRQSGVQAARTLRSWEESQRLLEAEEALDDPLRMLPYLLTNQALGGKVVGIDLEHKEQGKVRMVARPRVVLETPERCTMPVGKALYWTETPDKKPYVVVHVEHLPKGGSRVTLQHETSAKLPRPARGKDAVFSIHATHRSPPLFLPDAAPWTHVPEEEERAPGPIDEPTEAWE
jgi:hypothetical protein